MLNMLPKSSQKVFGNGKLKYFRECVRIQRKRIAHKLQNPRIERITFHMLRHFYGSMEYHKTKDVLHVKERLGHRSINSTMIYTHLVSFERDEYTVRVAKNLDEAIKLLEGGFEYVTDYNYRKVFRKKK